MNPSINYYALLDISPSASQEEIKQAYRKKALQYHPDVSTEPDAEARFKLISEAYQVLSSPQQRIAYDFFRGTQRQKRSTTYSPPPPSANVDARRKRRVQQQRRRFGELLLRAFAIPLVIVCGLAGLTRLMVDSQERLPASTASTLSPDELALTLTPYHITRPDPGPAIAGYLPDEARLNWLYGPVDGRLDLRDNLLTQFPTGVEVENFVVMVNFEEHANYSYIGEYGIGFGEGYILTLSDPVSLYWQDGDTFTEVGSINSPDARLQAVILIVYKDQVSLLMNESLVERFVLDDDVDPGEIVLVAGFDRESTYSGLVVSFSSLTILEIQSDK